MPKNKATLTLRNSAKLPKLEPSFDSLPVPGLIADVAGVVRGLVNTTDRESYDKFRELRATFVLRCFVRKYYFKIDNWEPRVMVEQDPNAAMLTPIGSPIGAADVENPRRPW